MVLPAVVPVPAVVPLVMIVDARPVLGDDGVVPIFVMHEHFVVAVHDDRPVTNDRVTNDRRSIMVAVAVPGPQVDGDPNPCAAV